jgi:hypothetical protein
MRGAQNDRAPQIRLLFDDTHARVSIFAGFAQSLAGSVRRIVTGIIPDFGQTGARATFDHGTIFHGVDHDIPFGGGKSRQRQTDYKQTRDYNSFHKRLLLGFSEYSTPSGIWLLLDTGASDQSKKLVRYITFFLPRGVA